MGRLALACLFLVIVFSAPVSAATTFIVHQGDNLQAVLNQALPGDTVVLDSGATFTGPITLPSKGGNSFITIQSSGLSSLPEGRRVSPSGQQFMAKIVSPPLQPALKTDPGASFYKLLGIEFTMPNQDGLPTDDRLTTYAIVLFGDPLYTSATQLPRQLILDRCYVHGWPTRDVKRGVEIHSKDTSITNSYISEIHWSQGDSQGIGGYNGPGPYHIVNNFVEAAGENIIFGGAPPGIQFMIADGVDVRRNYLSKKPSWFTSPPCGGTWRVKNLFELKSAKNVFVDGNVMEYNWGCGYGAINLTVRNDSGQWATIQNVTLSNNVLRHTALAVNIMGLDDNGQPSVQGRGLTIAHNLFDDISETWGDGSSAVWVQIKSMNDVTLDHNTAFPTYRLMGVNDNVVVGAKMTGFAMKNNIVNHGLYGISGFVPAHTPGAPFVTGESVITTHFANPPLPPIDHNVIIGGDPNLYPSYASANAWPATPAGVGFVNYAAGDYRLANGTPFKNAGSDNRDRGADFDILGMLTAGTTGGVWTTNFIDNTKYFVRQHYVDFLSREPDGSGLNFWTGQIDSCTPQPTCISTKRIDASGAFFESIEFQQSGYLVYKTYKASFGDTTSPGVAGTVPIVRMGEFLPDTQQIGRGVVVGATGWEALLEANKVAYFKDFVRRPRWVSGAPTSATPAQLVDALFFNAGVTPTAAERQAAINEFGGASDTADLDARARALRRVAENPTLDQNERNRALVLMQYFGYLRRNPNDPPEQTLNYAGWKFWLDKLNQFNGDWRAAELVKAFITSTEYRKRFGE